MKQFRLTSYVKIFKICFLFPLQATQRCFILKILILSLLTKWKSLHQNNPSWHISHLKDI